MAPLLGGVQGTQGEATRLGSENFPIRARVQTWTSQIRVVLHADGQAVVQLENLATGHVLPLWEGNADDAARAMR